MDNTSIEPGKNGHVSGATATVREAVGATRAGKRAGHLADHLAKYIAGVTQANDLQVERFPDVAWAIPDVLPEGLTMIAGKPKQGKSWLALHVAIAVASGGVALNKHRVEGGPVLYLALEDGRRRLQRRLRKLVPEGDAPKDLELQTEWPHLDQGGIDLIEEWIRTRPGARLVIIDTFKKVRPRTNKRGNMYDEDYESLEPLQSLAMKHNIAVLVVHHLNQGTHDDPLEAVSGSSGLMGAVDGAMVLKRERGRADAYLYVVHRDLEDDLELALTWSQETATWSIAGTAGEYKISQERAAVMEVLRGGPPEGLLPKEIGEGMAYAGTPATSPEALRKLLRRMFSDGQLESSGTGRYVLCGHSGHSGHSTDTYGAESVTPENTPCHTSPSPGPSDSPELEESVTAVTGEDGSVTGGSVTALEGESGHSKGSVVGSVTGVTAVTPEGGKEESGAEPGGGKPDKARRLTEEEASQVQALISKGTPPADARARVIGGVPGQGKTERKPGSDPEPGEAQPVFIKSPSEGGAPPEEGAEPRGVARDDATQGVTAVPPLASDNTHPPREAGTRKADVPLIMNTGTATATPPLSALAVALRDYLDRNPGDAGQSAGWMGVTLWAYDLVPGKPTREAVLAATEELGGHAYMREVFGRARPRR